MKNKTECKNFESRILQHVELVYSVALQLTSDPPKAEALAQDTISKAWESRERLEKTASLKTWLLSTLREAFIKEYRGRHRVAHVRLEPVCVQAVAARGN